MLKGRHRLQPVQPRHEGRRLAATALAQKQFDKVAQRADVVAVAGQRVAERGFGGPGVTGTVVDHAERVAGIEEARVVQHGGAGVAVSLVDLAGGQNFRRSVVQEHRDDGRLFERPGALATQFVLRDEIDRQAFTRALRKATAGGRRPEHQVDVTAGHVQAAAAAVEVIGLHGLEADGQAKLAGKAGRHDHQRKAISRARCEGLRRRPGAAGVVIQSQPALAVQRGDQFAPRVGVACQRRQFARRIRPHLIAQCKDCAGVGRRLRRTEEFVMQDLRAGCGRRHAGAGDQKRTKQNSGSAHRHGHQVRQVH